MAEIVKLGSLYLNGLPQEVGVEYNNERFSIGNAFSGKEIQWVKLKSGLLIATRCVCISISWEQLADFGLVFGTVIQIDGKWYLCRCLKVGDADAKSSEWDGALIEAGNDDAIWHWKDIFFWGQETVRLLEFSRAVRGYLSARGWSYEDATHRIADVGFRPALEPVMPAPKDYSPLVGAIIAPMGSDKQFVSGKLVSVTDYDLVLEQPSPLPAACKWAVPDRKRVVVDRSSVNWMRR